ncbi:YihY/virulence factor BrkB family protein [Natronococcus sp. A-GB7]|uniref:YihY/virulence factor BrkB family protein n=1 Tax=Natronococcus sp. A-GB7 TaxID=3037649 RepID=UPI00241E6915|nr:YihY/virulence factor BrkB family protein [Natronococcus sp. A-GB7]MDG5819104.1 YihY/virulence factor BrkB family protein [Natronococcus sp. A-GB7]
MLDYSRALELGTRLVQLARQEQLTLLAAGVAFYAFLSLAPLALLSLAIAASIGGETLAAQVTDTTDDVLTPSAQALLTETIVDETGQQGATVVGALGLLWGSSRVFRGLDRAFSSVYGTVASKSLVDTFWDATIAAAAIVIGLSIVAGIELVVRFVPFTGQLVLGPLFVLLGLIAAFLPLYMIFPDANVDVREALPGTLLAAVGWFVLSRVFSLYADLAGQYAVYGALGAVFLVLVWLYAGAIILVFGATLNAVLADRELDRQLQSPRPRQLSTEAMTDDATGADEGTTRDRPDPDDTDRTRTDSSARTRDRADDADALREEIERLRDRIDEFETSVERRTVEKESLQAELKRYVRRRVRRGHAHGWGPYLVLLYGTAMSIAAFYFLSGGWAILALLVVFTSTLGLYVLMVLLGAGLTLLGVPGRLRNVIGERRS